MLRMITGQNYCMVKWILSSIFRKLSNHHRMPYRPPIFVSRALGELKPLPKSSVGLFLPAVERVDKAIGLRNRVSVTTLYRESYSNNHRAGSSNHDLEFALILY